MEDVVDDFSTLGRVAARLGEWRTSDVDSYQSAYVSLVLHRWVLPSCPHHSQVKDLISLSWQDILPHRETSPAILVTFHIYCCYFWAALVCTGNHEAEWISCNSIMYNFSLPPIAWALRRLWTNFPKTLTGFYFLPLLRRFHPHAHFIFNTASSWTYSVKRWWWQSWLGLFDLGMIQCQQTKPTGNW